MRAIFENDDNYNHSMKMAIHFFHIKVEDLWLIVIFR